MFTPDRRSLPIGANGFSTARPKPRVRSTSQYASRRFQWTPPIEIGTTVQKSNEASPALFRRRRRHIEQSRYGVGREQHITAVGTTGHIELGLMAATAGIGRR